jgi:hypothetical protein
MHRNDRYTSIDQGFAMQFKLVPGRLDIETEGIRFWLSDGANTFSCFVTHFVLQDLGGHYLPSANLTDLQAFAELLPEIEHLANAKYNLGRTEESGGVTIGTADFLRRALSRPVARFDQTRMNNTDCVVDDSLLVVMITQLGRINIGHVRTPDPVRR